MDWLSDAARLLSADVWEDLDQLLADVRLLVVLHRLQVQLVAERGSICLVLDVVTHFRT